MRVKVSLASLLLCVVFLLIFSRTAAARNVIYVDANAPGANNGSSWENAYVYLQDALADAEAADKPIEIRVAKGVYKPNQGAGNRRYSFQLVNGINLSGGYAGLTEPVPDVRDIEKYKTILSGDLNNDDIDVINPSELPHEPTRSDNSELIISGSYTNRTAVLDGFIITGGQTRRHRAAIDVPTGIGGGMENYSGSPTINNCTFIGNSAEVNGGGMLNDDGSDPILTNCKFIKNYGRRGGGAYNSNSNPTFINCTFTNNFADSGAGIYNLNSSLTLINCLFIENSTREYYNIDIAPSFDGGAMFNKNSDPNLTNCMFNANLSVGMCNQGSSPTLTNCTFSMNQYNGMVNRGSNPILRACKFTGNVAQKGGGMYNDGRSEPHVTNSIFSGNIAISEGGGIYDKESSKTTLINCTLTGNSARSGGGIFSQEPISVLINCILWNNTPDQITGLRTIRNSNIQGGIPSEGNIDVNPLFVKLGYWVDANDPNIVVDSDDPNAFWIDGDYHLKSQAGRWDPVSKSWVFDDVTSPCIDAGDPNSPVAFEPFPNGDIINMGAYGGTAEASLSPSGIHAKYGGGTGGPHDPYQIATAEDLMLLGETPEDYDKHFILTADIDMDPNLPGRKVFDKTVIAQDVNERWGFQGTAFTGIFDGNNHSISHLTFSGENTFILGMFGEIGVEAKISNLGLEALYINGSNGYVGGLVGHNYGIITNCYCNCTISNLGATWYVGGLVGENYGIISECYSMGTISGSILVGGLVGYQYNGTIACSFSTAAITGNSNVGGLVACNDYGEITACYSTCTVTGDKYVGGIVGCNNGYIANSYSTGMVTGDNVVGGLVGRNGQSAFYDRLVSLGTINNCYSTGVVSDNINTGGLVGRHEEGDVSASFWDTQTSGRPDSNGGTVLNTKEMQMAITFLEAGWDFVDETANGTEDIWWIFEGQDYPRLWWELINEK